MEADEDLKKGEEFNITVVQCLVCRRGCLWCLGSNCSKAVLQRSPCPPAPRLLDHQKLEMRPCTRTELCSFIAPETGEAAPVGGGDPGGQHHEEHCGLYFPLTEKPRLSCEPLERLSKRHCQAAPALPGWELLVSVTSNAVDKVKRRDAMSDSDQQPTS